MFRKTMIALAATAALAGGAIGSAEAKHKKHFDIDINFGGGGYGWGGGYGGGYGYGDDYCGWKVIKKKIWVDTPWGPKKKIIKKKVNTCWY
jgi:hypothetical protein